MSNRMVNVGFGNLVNSDKIIAVVNPDGAPVKRLVQQAREEGRVVDATSGRKTKAVIVCESDRIVLSPLIPDTIGRRLSGSAGPEQVPVS